MSLDAVPSVLAPVRLGSLVLPNRVVLAPMTRTRATQDHAPTPLMAEYYAQRAEAGLLITECTAVSPQAEGIFCGPAIHRWNHIEGWKTVTSAVHAAGGRIYCQLWHAGRVAHPTLLAGETPVSASAIAAVGSIFTGTEYQPFTAPRAVRPNELIGIKHDFAVAAKSAHDAGFDGVELHAANGYLLDQFIRDGSNHRADDYGGTPERRCRFLFEVVEALIGVLGGDKVGVRLSPASSLYGMHDSDPSATFGCAVAGLSRLGVGYIHIIEGGLPGDDAHFPNAVRTLRPMIQGPAVIANGGMTHQQANRLIASGTADLVSFGRPFIANPDLIQRFRNGWPLAPEADRSVWYGSGAAGYTDFPPYAGAATPS